MLECVFFYLGNKKETSTLGKGSFRKKELYRGLKIKKLENIILMHTCLYEHKIKILYTVLIFYAVYDKIKISYIGSAQR